MAVQFEQLDLSSYAKINDTTSSASTTYSSQKIEEILPEAGAVIDDSEASTTKTYSSTHIDETYLKKDGNGSGVSVEYTASDTGGAPISGSMLGNLIGWLVGKCNGIGNISNLLTVAKSNLVAAINELRGEIGDLTQLDTTEKTDLVAAINKLNSKITPLSNNASKQAKQPYTVGHKYYFDEDGWIYFECQMTNANGYCRFRIFNASGSEIFSYQANATATQRVSIVSGLYPVKKGWYTQLGQYQSTIAQQFYFIKP